MKAPSPIRKLNRPHAGTSRDIAHEGEEKPRLDQQGESVAYTPTVEKNQLDRITSINGLHT
jgi:Golgi nucleoside diphosphatase